MTFGIFFPNYNSIIHICDCTPFMSGAFCDHAFNSFPQKNTQFVFA
uniref:Uncharacterized protein n=1 Tax=Arundo donax TaxID=35708 RepID=A0A0A9FTV6_ARUDO